MRVLLLGYGDIASRVARRLTAQAGVEVVGICRNPEHKSAPQGVTLQAADISNEQDLKPLLQNQHWDVAVVTLTPAEYSDEGYRQGYVVPMRHLQMALHQHPNIQRLLYISSTSVYQHQAGEWVDENTPTQPQKATAKRLLEAERLVASFAAETAILRCSGIYGPGRTYALKRSQQTDLSVTDAWTNRIHSEDVAKVIVALLHRQQALPDTLLVTDNQPSRQANVYRWLAQQQGVDCANWTEQTAQELGKRCSNQRLRELGIVLDFPSYREGYSALLR
ncbi:NAD(P)-dependent oxidoreductase [Idiomarina tyrosinivorans]|uniref:NAD(P)-dependent oxidoreductase n=1 Tax=Idiomarina tyrosinivorans TaxID=1445662 RepID=A0A432ZPL1_9GAMM|nr:SDR family oxidoreductase [Idiomarina tyrosinivorans]RUO79768.1 NAD(P)-dependent oxidoreductase [Idiomarina tyrosinivorans]